MSLIIKLISLGNNSGPFDVYTDADNYTTPIHTNVDSSVLLQGLVTDNVPLLAENIKLKNKNVFCTNEVSARLYQPLFYNNYILDSAVTSDCKLIFYGAYTQYGGATANHITKIDKCGNIDQTFTNNVGSGFAGHGVYVSQGITIDSNNNIYVGSWFTSYNGVSKNYAVKLNSEGTIDESFNIGTGFQWFTNVPFLDEANGAIYFGGAFTSYKGVSQRLLIKLDLLGNKIPEFNVGTGFETTVEGILEAGNNKMWVHGYFSTYNGTTANKIVLLDKTTGAKDTSFSTGTGPNNAGNKKPMIVVTDGEKLLIGSDYGITTYNGATISKNIFRLNRDGSIDTSFLAGTGFDVGGGVQTIYNDNGKFLISGLFTSYNGTPVKALIRLNNDGTIDETFNCNLTNGQIYTINKLGDYYYMPLDENTATYIIRVDEFGNWNYLMNSPSCNSELTPCDIIYSFTILEEKQVCCLYITPQPLPSYTLPTPVTVYVRNSEIGVINTPTAYGSDFANLNNGTVTIYSPGFELKMYSDPAATQLLTVSDLPDFTITPSLDGLGGINCNDAYYADLYYRVVNIDYPGNPEVLLVDPNNRHIGNLREAYSCR